MTVATLVGHETPWVIVFDRLHFERREGDLRHFVNELTRSGRPAIVLAVTGPIKPIEFYGEAFVQEIAAPTTIFKIDPDHGAPVILSAGAIRPSGSGQCVVQD